VTRAEIERITAVWQERLGLDRWDIRVRWELSPPKGCDAEVRIAKDYEQASIRIQQTDDPESDPQTKPFTTWSQEYANYTVVHELLHIFEYQTKRSVEALEGVISASAYDMFAAWYDHGAENWVDRLAQRLVELVGCV
jgi:hypothetical protein